MSLGQRLRGHAVFQPDKAAIEYSTVTTPMSISYAQLQRDVSLCVDWFSSLDLRRGDRLALLALNHPDWFVLLFAAAQYGVVLVPLNWRLSQDELRYVLEDSDPILLLHDSEFESIATGITASAERNSDECKVDNDSGNECEELTTPVELSLKCLRLHAAGTSTPSGEEKAEQFSDNRSAGEPLTDALLIVYTSGTTGRSKGAVLSEQTLLCSAAMSQHMFDLTSADRALNVLPLFHVGGLNIQPLPVLLYGGTVVLHPRFDAGNAVKSLDNDGITLINSVPTLLQAIIDEPAWTAATLESLRAISIGSTDVPISLIRQVHARGIPLLQVYGATETGPVAIYQRLDLSPEEGSIGRAGLLCEIQLSDAQGLPVALGESGEIWVRGNNVLSAYWNNPAASEECLCDGWFRTGDIAHCDEQGNYWFDDRLKHVVISGGENIYPAELERVIREVPGVQEVSVVGRPDQRWGEVPVAFVVASTDMSEATILTACQSLARFKHPKGVIFVDALPRNALGKIVVAEVRKLLLSH
ncbi:MAG: AMP-binding protein [Granulosicoccus sp.]|nr:AMP-binding protein [Granulosicoccus sp.]